MEEGLDTFVVLDGLPKVPEDSKPKLIKFILRKLRDVGTTDEGSVFMPSGDNGQTEGYAALFSPVRLKFWFLTTF